MKMEEQFFDLLNQFSSSPDSDIALLYQRAQNLEVFLSQRLLQLLEEEERQLHDFSHFKNSKQKQFLSADFSNSPRLQTVLTALCSLPDRVANKMMTQTPLAFRPEYAPLLKASKTGQNFASATLLNCSFLFSCFCAIASVFILVVYVACLYMTMCATAKAVYSM